MTMKAGRFCQSCGMPMNDDPQHGGTEADGTRSAKYCSFCYRDGIFLNPKVDTPRKMQARCIEKLTEHGMSRVTAWLLTRGIPRLERWKL